MKTYGLYLESGPKRRTTMVHVLDLLGCIAVGATTEDALAATPAAIEGYRRFLRDHGEAIDADAPFRTKVVEHITEGMWLGHGSPYAMFGPDLKPVGAKEIDVLLRRFVAMREELAAYAERATQAQLDGAQRDGRGSRAVLLHVLPGPGDYLSAAVGGSVGYGKVRSAAERSELPLGEAFRRIAAMASERVRATTPAERSAVITRPNDQRTLRKALRRMLEHDWEHLAELSRRPDGPRL